MLCVRFLKFTAENLLLQMKVINSKTEYKLTARAVNGKKTNNRKPINIDVDYISFSNMFYGITHFI